MHAIAWGRLSAYLECDRRQRLGSDWLALLVLDAPLVYYGCFLQCNVEHVSDGHVCQVAARKLPPRAFDNLGCTDERTDEGHPERCLADHVIRPRELW